MKMVRTITALFLLSSPLHVLVLFCLKTFVSFSLLYCMAIHAEPIGLRVFSFLSPLAHLFVWLNETEIDVLICQISLEKGANFLGLPPHTVWIIVSCSFNQ